MKKNWMAAAAAAVLCLTVVSYLSVSADYGDANDPLVSLSYINKVVLPQANTTIQNTFNAKKQEFDATMSARVEECKTIITELLNDYNSPESLDDAMVDEVAVKLAALMEQGTAAAAPDAWKVVRVEAGRSLKGQVGCQMLLRFGKAVVTAETEPGLINLSTGGELLSGVELESNNLYMVTIKNNGIRVQENATLLICGEYTVQ